MRAEDFNPHFVPSPLKKKFLQVSRKIVPDRIKQTRRLYSRQLRLQRVKMIATGERG